MCILFAATYPQRTAALVLCESYANWLHDDENHWAPTRDQHEEVARLYERRWGEPVGISAFAPTMAKDGEFRRRFGTYSRMAASPGAAASLLRMNDEMDVRPVLPSVRVPTLVLHRRHDRIIDIEGGRYLAAHIPDARLVEFEGDDHLPWVGDSDAIVDEIEEFLTGMRHVAEPESWQPFCSVTLLRPPSGPPPWETNGGANCSTVTPPNWRANSIAFRDAW